jgi:hypothetical protein
MEETATFEDLFELKNSRDPVCNWYNKVITATTKKDFTMEVWNGNHPPEKNTISHVCKAGTRVRIWMVSRFGDCGITDNLKNPHGYDCRGVDVDADLENITIADVIG